MSTPNVISQNKKIYSAYDLHISQNLACDLAGDKTKQSFGNECNINSIMAKYEKTGVIESGNSCQPLYGECSEFDFQNSQNIVIQAENMFNALPADIRSRFNNDPATLLRFMDEPQNQAEAVKLGLLPPLKVLPDTAQPEHTAVPPTPRKTPTKGEGDPTPLI